MRFQNKPSPVVLIVDFNAISITFFFKDAPTLEISCIKNIGYKIFVVKITRKLPCILDISPLCIDLIFTWQPMEVIESVLHSSMDSKDHLQNLYGKFNLKFVTVHNFFGSFDTTKIQITIPFKEQLKNLIGIGSFYITMLMKNWRSSKHHS